jgi:hypothetical protein
MKTKGTAKISFHRNLKPQTSNLKPQTSNLKRQPYFLSLLGQKSRDMDYGNTYRQRNMANKCFFLATLAIASSSSALLASGFINPATNLPRRHVASPSASSILTRRIYSKKSEEKNNAVDQLLKQVESASKDPTNTNGDEIKDLIEQLTTTSSNTTMDDDDDDNDEAKFLDDLIGYYNVSYTLTSNSKDNPVGGKWTRSQSLWNIKRTMQHVLPLNSEKNDAAVAQVVNLIYLECLWGILPIWIILRGDAVLISKDNNEQVQEQYSKKKRQQLVPNLSKRTVRAYFDKPRIALGKVLISFGPTSSVVLDTPYMDNRIRLGVGGTSGTKFVFRRLPKDDKEAIDAWKWILEKPSMITKNNSSLSLLIVGLLSSYGWTILRGVSKYVSGISAFLSFASLGLVLSSTGGIETRGDTYTPGNKK